mmetsp:Transcript_85250/g.183851  ORF Transcript_85250/g.183851 Transcript_85250/m.183851 type:complete len:146 (+) Transcript_85250:414-851(+)
MSPARLEVCKRDTTSGAPQRCLVLAAVKVSPSCFILSAPLALRPGGAPGALCPSSEPRRREKALRPGRAPLGEAPPRRSAVACYAHAPRCDVVAVRDHSTSTVWTGWARAWIRLWTYLEPWRRGPAGAVTLGSRRDVSGAKRSST